MTLPQTLTLIRPDILTLSSYPVSEAVGLVKLDAMENPFPLPESLAAELGHRLGKVALNRYPAARPTTLIEKLKRTMHIPPDSEVLLGNGSDEIIQIILTACAKPGAKLLTPVPSFVMVEIAARLAQLDFIGIPLTADFKLDREAMLAAIAERQPAVIYLAYPNNPTSTLFDETVMEQIIDTAKSSLVVIDEAYQPFAKRTWLLRVHEFANLLVMRTMSKLGLAGIRLGYLVGAPAWLAQFDKVRPPYNINALTQAAADFLLDHLPIFDAQAVQLCNERARLAAAIALLPDTVVYPSAGNFLLIRLPNAQKVFEALLSRRILVKNLSTAHPLLANCLRITVGTPDENIQLMEALTVALAH